MKMRRYNFRKTRPFMRSESAEGLAVHAESMEQAKSEAQKLLEKGERLLGFRDNNPCVSNCWHCR